MASTGLPMSIVYVIGWGQSSLPGELLLKWKSHRWNGNGFLTFRAEMGLSRKCQTWAVHKFEAFRSWGTAPVSLWSGFRTYPQGITAVSLFMVYKEILKGYKNKILGWGGFSIKYYQYQDWICPGFIEWFLRLWKVSWELPHPLVLSWGLLKYPPSSFQALR